MRREEKLEEMGELADHIIGALRSGTFIPMSFVRRYNDLVQAVFGGEDPEIMAADALWKKKKNCKECEHYLPERPPYEVYDYCDLLQDIPDGGKACPLK